MAPCNREKDGMKDVDDGGEKERGVSKHANVRLGRNDGVNHV